MCIRDRGIIHAWKKRYKTALSSIRVDTMAEARELRRQAKEQKMKAGTLGLAQGYQPHILDAIELGRTAWDGVSKGVIARCVLRAVVVGISLTLCGFATARGLTVA